MLFQTAVNKMGRLFSRLLHGPQPHRPEEAEAHGANAAPAEKVPSERAEDGTCRAACHRHEQDEGPAEGWRILC